MKWLVLALVIPVLVAYKAGSTYAYAFSITGAGVVLYVASIVLMGKYIKRRTPEILDNDSWDGTEIVPRWVFSVRMIGFGFILAGIITAILLWGGVIENRGFQRKISHNEVTTEQGKSLKHLANAIRYYNESSDVLGVGYFDRTVSPEKMTKSIELLRLALSEAKEADIHALNMRFSGLGNHVRDEFVTGMTLYLDAYEKTDNNKLQRAQRLLDNWVQYYRDNTKKIKQRSR